MAPSPVRLHLGCGPVRASGWINADTRPLPTVDVVCDLRRRLPFADCSFDCAVAMHVLQDLAWCELGPATRELARVLRPGGTLRLGLPDLERAIEAYQRADARYFHVPDDDARALGAKLVTQIIWYGSVRTPFTFDFAAELLDRAGFAEVRRAVFGASASGRDELTLFDNRPRESFYVEAVR